MSETTPRRRRLRSLMRLAQERRAGRSCIIADPTTGVLFWDARTTSLSTWQEAPKEAQS